ncbi:MAG: membrane assembly protein AsmA, partial [Bacteroidota bacterium]
MKRTLAVLLSLLAILLGVLVAVPLIFGDKLINLAKEKANQSVNAKIDFEDYDITVFRSFPDLTLVVNNLKISGVNEFSGVDLASIKTFGITVDLKSVISGNTVVVKGLEIERPIINVLVLENGKANYDIAKPSPEETVSE